MKHKDTMDELPTTGVLHNGSIYTSRYLYLEDLSAIMALQEKVESNLQSKTNLQPLSREEFAYILRGSGFMIGVFTNEQLIGFRAMLIPEIDNDHLGFDCGLHTNQLPYVLYSEVSCVDPDFRGNGLQTIMGNILFTQVDRESFHYICATVSPNNIPSIKDKLALGMRIVALKEKYDGKMRYIFLKHLQATAFFITNNDKIAVSIDNIGEQQNLLQTGYAGVDLVQTTDTWNVLYGNAETVSFCNE